MHSNCNKFITLFGETPVKRYFLNDIKKIEGSAFEPETSPGKAIHSVFPDWLKRPTVAAFFLLLAISGNWALIGRFQWAIAHTTNNPPNPGVYNRIRNASLNASQFENLVCWFYEQGDDNASGGGSSTQICRVLSNQPGFWNDIGLRDYRYRRNSAGTQTDIGIFYNFIGATQRDVSNGQDRMSDGNYTATINNANVNVPAFNPPSWFSPVSNANSERLIAHKVLRTDEVGAPYTGNPVNSPSFTFYRTGDASRDLSVPYTLGGTAQRGVHYTVDLGGSCTGGCTNVNPNNRIYFAAGQRRVVYRFPATSAMLLDDQPQRTLSLTMQQPNGYSRITAATDTTFYRAFGIPDVDIVRTGSTTVVRGQSTSFTIRRREATGGIPFDNSQPLTVRYIVGGTASNGSDYQSIPGQITIPAGQNDASVTIRTSAPTGSQPQENITISLTGTVSADGYEITGTNRATFTLQGFMQASVSASNGGDDTLNRGESQSITFSRTGNTSSPLTVNFTASGSATQGEDYALGSSQVVIPAGQTSAILNITGLSDTIAEPAENLTLTVVPNGSSYVVDTSNPSTTLTIPSFNPSDVSVAPSPTSPNGSTIERGEIGVMRFTRSGGDQSSPLVIEYTVGGTATPGTDPATDDYQSLSGTATIPAGQSFVDVDIPTLSKVGQDNADPRETIEITLDSGSFNISDLSPSIFTLPPYSPPLVQITPNATLSVDANGNPQLERDGQPHQVFTIDRGNDTTGDLSIPYTIGGTATPGTDPAMADFEPLSNTLLIPDGQSSATIDMTPLIKSDSEPLETVTLTLQAGAGYALPTDGSESQTVNLLPYQAPILQIAPDPNLPTNANGVPIIDRDGQSHAVFTVDRGSDTSVPLSIPYITGGTATPGADPTAADYEPLSGTLTIPAGQQTGVIDVTPLIKSGSLSESEETIVLTLQDGVGYDIPIDGSGTQPVALREYESPSVSFEIPSERLAFGQSATVRIERSGDTTQPLTVPINIGGTAQAETDYEPDIPDLVIIPAGQSSAEFQITPVQPTGRIPQPAETISLEIPQSNDYNGTDQVTLTIPVYEPADIPLTTTSQAEPPQFTVSLPIGQTAQEPIDIPYTLGGSALPGEDYTTPSTRVITIPAGEMSATVPIQLTSDPTPGRSITLQPNPPSGYLTQPATLIIPSSNVIIQSTGDLVLTAGSFDQLCRNSICTDDLRDIQRTNVDIPFNIRQYQIPSNAIPYITIERSPDDPSTAPVTIRYDVGGTAIPDVDYVDVPRNATIPAGEDIAQIPIIWLPEAKPDGTIELAFEQPGNGFSITPSEITLEANPSLIPVEVDHLLVIDAEDTHNPPGIEIKRPANAPLDEPITILYRVIGGTAIPDEDFRMPLVGEFTIPAGEMSGFLPIGVLDGATPGRTIDFELDAPDGYGIDEPTFEFTIEESDIPSDYSEDGGDDDGGGNGLGAVAAGVVGVGGLGALTLTGGGGGNSCPVGSVIPQALINTAIEQLTATTPDTGNTVTLDLDWNSITLDSLGLINNQPADQAFTLNQYQGVDDLSIGDIRAAVGREIPESILFSTISQNTTLVALAEMTEGRTIRETNMLQTLIQEPGVSSSLDITISEVEGMTLAELIEVYPAIGDIDLGQTPLAQMSFTDDIEIGDIQGWERMTPDQIPLMSAAPLGQLFPCLTAQIEDDIGRNDGVHQNFDDQIDGK